MKKDNCFTNYFMILVVILFMMLVYIYIGSVYTAKSLPPKESFNNTNENTLLNKDKLLVIQGNTIPDRGGKQINFDQNDPSFQSVDGTDKTPKSMFMFAFNKCSPECCGSSPYNCQGGCVCLTNSQTKFLSTRGNNNKHNKCSSNEY
jgi:hypothetical protein